MTEWLDELPGRAPRGGGRYSKYDPFAEELKTKPGLWKAWPVNSLTIGSLRSMASSINTKNRFVPRSFREGKWEAAVRQNILYVRFMGEE